GDASEFNSERLKVEGERIGRYRVMRCTSPAIPNAIAAILLNIRDITGKQPHVYLGWTEGNPVLYVIKFIFLGEGETAPVTREILREVEPDPKKRPRVHVG
ncbi:MAG: amino acid transporter, partial [Cyanobacteria bacterium SZAS LIN-3]|nr:amino acid transporter [Cyanobacteria bacterium SZAS LIN-3]